MAFFVKSGLYALAFGLLLVGLAIAFRTPWATLKHAGNRRGRERALSVIVVLYLLAAVLFVAANVFLSDLGSEP